MFTSRSKRGPKPKGNKAAVEHLIRAGASLEHLAQVGGFSVRTARRRLKDAQRPAATGARTTVNQVRTLAPKPSKPTREALEANIDQTWDDDLAHARAWFDLAKHDDPSAALLSANGAPVLEAIQHSDVISARRAFPCIREPADLAQLIGLAVFREDRAQEDGESDANYAAYVARHVDENHARAIACAEETLRLVSETGRSIYEVPSREK